MPKVEKPLSPKRRYGTRVMELSRRDPEIGQLIPDNDVREKALEKNLTLDRVMGVFLDGYGERPAMGERSYRVEEDPISGKNIRNYLPSYNTSTYREFHDRIKAISMAWRTHPECRVGPDDFVMIIGFADIDFLSIDMACAYAKATTVPVQSSTSGADLNEMVANIEPVTIAATLCDLSLAVQLATTHDSIKSIIVFNYDDRIDTERAMVNQAKQTIADSNKELHLFSISDLISFGSQQPWSFLPPDENDSDQRTAILHSSGSTGKPKGAVISRKAIIQNWLGKKTSVPRVTMHLAPLNHIMGRTNAVSILGCGGTGYFTLQPDLSSLLEDIRLARPTFMSLFPRIFELVHQHFQNEVTKRLRQGTESKTEIEAQVKVEMRNTYLGDRLLCIVFGSAPTSPKVQAFMKDCFDVLMVEGYGNTESGTGNLTLEDKINRANVIEYKLRDVPELGYYTSDKPFPRGELCVKTKFGIKEYYKQPEVTANLFDEEGYSCTGDIVEERAEDVVVVIDRRKDVLKLSQGEYVAVGALGTLYEAGSAVIMQIYVYGNSQRSYLVAVVVLESNLLKQSLGDQPSDAQIKNLLRDELNNVAQKEELKPFEVPRDFILEYEPFTQNNGLLSSVRKRLRPALKRKYGAALEALYELKDNADDDRIAAVKDPESTLSTIEKLVVILEGQLGVEITDTTQPRNFNALGGDSLGASLFSLTIEEVFDVLLPADMLLAPSGHLQQWAIFIEKANDDSSSGQVTFAEIHGKGAKNVSAEDLQLERFLESELLNNTSELPSAPIIPKTVLLTGANGFLGHIVCLEWMKTLSQTGGKLICIVREKDDAAAFGKLAKEYQGLDPKFEKAFTELAKNHLEVWAGDIARKNLGLSDERFQQLTTHVDRICHVAALVNHRLAYQHLFGPNVVGTSEIIRLAISKTRKPIDFISTVGVFRFLESSRGINETVPYKQQIELSDNYASGYGASKWAGEILLQKASERCDIPINIFRCDMILPDQEYKGQANESDMLTRILYSIVITGLAPQSFYGSRKSGRRKIPHYDGVPVDLLSKAIVGAYNQEHSECMTYHALNYLDDAVSLDRFVDWIASAGYTINRIPDHEEWYERMETKLKSLPEEQRQLSALNVLMAFRKPMYGGPSWIDSNNFKKLVSSLDTLESLPHLSEVYIHKYLEDLSLLGMIQKPITMANNESIQNGNKDNSILKVNGYAALEPKAKLQPYSYELGKLGPEQVDVKVSYCGICHSDLSMINNEWRSSQYPLVPGHEIVGEVVAAGSMVKNIKVGDKVGVGWFSESCMSCSQCMHGSQHLCRDRKTTIAPSNGGFADYVRSHWAWAIPLPEGIDMSKAGPLLCGGITVFNPIIAAGVLPTDRVGVIGIGGLGHLALKFLKSWGCEVYAFSSNESKKEQIIKMGASKVINSRSKEELKSVRGQLDFIINTTNVTLDWSSYLKALAPKGRFFNVGMVLEPMAIPAGLLIAGEKVVSGSPVGSPGLASKMLDFCVRHNIYPEVEEYPMDKVNEAMAHLEAGKARFRIVLKN
ncbi:MAG: fatty acid CoA ligase FadD9 [Saprospiraceae bacterium]|jgi:fatty acid CoA ligase FadD9